MFELMEIIRVEYPLALVFFFLYVLPYAVKYQSMQYCNDIEGVKRRQTFPLHVTKRK